MITLIRRVSAPQHVSLFDDRIAVVEKNKDASWRRIEKSDEGTIRKSDCVLIMFRGVDGNMESKATQIAFDKKLTGTWVITPNGLHQDEGRKFIHWGTEFDKAYYGEGDEGLHYGTFFSQWEGTIHLATKNLFDYFK
jgi:hypothetical protein